VPVDDGDGESVGVAIPVDVPAGVADGGADVGRFTGVGLAETAADEQPAVANAETMTALRTKSAHTSRPLRWLALQMRACSIDLLDSRDGSIGVAKFADNALTPQATR
jgi:hypothetical protein